MNDGEPRIISDPPLLVPARELVSEGQRQDLEERMREVLSRYRESLKGDRRHLFDGYRFVDMARKVVGVGSVGTQAWTGMTWAALPDRGVLCEEASSLQLQRRIAASPVPARINFAALTR